MVVGGVLHCDNLEGFIVLETATELATELMLNDGQQRHGGDYDHAQALSRTVA